MLCSVKKTGIIIVFWLQISVIRDKVFFFSVWKTSSSRSRRRILCCAYVRICCPFSMALFRAASGWGLPGWRLVYVIKPPTILCEWLWGWQLWLPAQYSPSCLPEGGLDGGVARVSCVAWLALDAGTQVLWASVSKTWATGGLRPKG